MKKLRGLVAPVLLLAVACSSEATKPQQVQAPQQQSQPAPTTETTKPPPPLGSREHPCSYIGNAPVQVDAVVLVCPYTYVHPRRENWCCAFRMHHGLSTQMEVYLLHVTGMLTTSLSSLSRQPPLLLPSRQQPLQRRRNEADTHPDCHSRPNIGGMRNHWEYIDTSSGLRFKTTQA